ncbi:MAG: MFS transporter [Dehalococcoidales bacterium]|nr:MFS transporter [Dehalococcoidales bacterium]
MLEHKKSGFSSIGSRTFSSLRNRAYRLYFLGVLGQFASMNMQMVTGSLLIYRLTDSAALLGTMALAHAAPMLVLSLFGGVIADRVPKKGILILGLAGSAIISFLVALSLTTGLLSRENAGSWWILIASSLLQGVVMGLMMPARQSIIPELVTREQTMNAVALNTLGMNVLSLIAPAAAGFLVDAFDFASVYYTMTGLNLYGVGFLIFLPRITRKTSAGSSIIADIKAGFSYVRSKRPVLLVLFFSLFFVVLSMPYRQLLPIFVDDILGVGATGMGVLMSASGAGAMVGSLALANLPNKKRGLILMLSGALSGLVLIAFAFSTSWISSLAFIVFVGLSQTGRITTSNALLQTYVDNAYMGRVMSIFMMQWGLVSFSTFFAGAMAEAIPVQWVVGGLALALLAVSLLALVFLPTIRKLD